MEDVVGEGVIWLTGRRLTIARLRTSNQWEEIQSVVGALLLVSCVVLSLNAGHRSSTVQRRPVSKYVQTVREVRTGSSQNQHEPAGMQR